MSINLQTLGNKLKGYRVQLAQSAADVAQATGIGGERLSAFETGQLEPSGDEILILADHFRCDFHYFISNERVAPFEETEVLYRAGQGEFTPADRQAIQEFLYLCDTEAMLLEALNRSKSKFDLWKLTASELANPSEAAKRIRTALGYSDIELIADVYQACRDLGLHTFRRKLGNSRISGLFVTHPTAGKCALVNSSEDIYRQRFSAAHEMAHAIFDADEPVSVSLKNVQNERETRANKFASALLMPRSFLERIPDSKNWTDAKAIEWANRLKVSCSALGYALKTARLINSQLCDHIISLKVPKEMKSDPELPASLTQGEQNRKANLLHLGLSDFYVQLCFDGLREGVISLGRLSEALLCTPSELSELASLYKRTIHVS
ncbi:Zn-dependent peptidase ImmA, M78 family [Duganella sacchari]|uniref:Zn-dependent peptidase ImmA, M78 family n=1 Tax=Duganella sacchari TaxID=551987 RepID=A0A1M7NKE8_9BURK|nr:XRE family transcriptional regulator [Duganella sacchari]SHN04342.1 Zn-dependent peptidase ImmA, M78 family [Duganella sacchari]